MKYYELILAIAQLGRNASGLTEDAKEALSAYLAEGDTNGQFVREGLALIEAFLQQNGPT